MVNFFKIKKTACGSSNHLIISSWWWPVPLAQSSLGWWFSLTFFQRPGREHMFLLFFSNVTETLVFFVGWKMRVEFWCCFWIFHLCENLGFRDDWDKSLSHGRPFYPGNHEIGQSWWGRRLFSGILTTTVLREAGEMLWTWSRKKCVPMIDLECP